MAALLRNDNHKQQILFSLRQMDSFTYAFNYVFTYLSYPISSYRTNVKVTEVKAPSRDDLQELLIMQNNSCETDLVDRAYRMSFVGVKVNKAILQLLIYQKADVRGIDITDQVLAGTDFTDVNLFQAVCTRTDFSSTKLIRTNLTGVDLASAIFDEGTQIDGVIVSNEDRWPYVQNLQRKLAFILSEGKSEKSPDDAFYYISPVVIRNLYRSILFELTEHSFLEGRTSVDGGPQDIFLMAGFDMRQINKDGLLEGSIAFLVEYATKRLTGNEFTQAQKSLFHYARSAMWQLIELNSVVHFQDAQNPPMKEFFRKEKLKEIYIMGGANQPRVTPQLLDVCFYAVLPIVLERYPDMSWLEAGDVYALFASPHYSW